MKGASASQKIYFKIIYLKLLENYFFLKSPAFYWILGEHFEEKNGHPIFFEIFFSKNYETFCLQVKYQFGFFDNCTTGFQKKKT